MKTNGIARGNSPENNPDQFPLSAGVSATPGLSENAFYLIALASLLRKSVGPGVLRQFLVPGEFAGYGNTGASVNES